MLKKVLSILLLVVVICLAGCTQSATQFPMSTIDNGYNNYIAGGNMACVDDSLYVNYIAGSFYIGTYKVNADGATKLFDENIDIDYSFISPAMYQSNDNLYFADADYSKFYIFDRDSDMLTDNALDIYSGNGICYISEDLTVYYTDDAENLVAKYKDNKEIELNKNAASFTVYDNKIYLITPKGALYYNDPSLLSSDCEFVSKLSEDGILSKIVVCNGYCYFTDRVLKSSDRKEGVYRYSFKEGKIEPVLQKEVLSMNVQGSKVYFATDSGVYVADSIECKKFSNKKAEEIYVFDDEWVYLYDRDKAKIYRVSGDGEQLQEIAIE